MSYPATWRNTNPSEVGERIYGGANQALQKAFNAAYVAAAFSDWQGPTYDGCYLDYIWVEVNDDQPTKVSDLSKIRADIQAYLDYLHQNFSQVKLLEPMREVQIGTATGFDYTLELPRGQSDPDAHGLRARRQRHGVLPRVRRGGEGLEEMSRHLRPDPPDLRGARLPHRSSSRATSQSSRAAGRACTLLRVISNTDFGPRAAPFEVATAIT